MHVNITHINSIEVTHGTRNVISSNEDTVQETGYLPEKDRLVISVSPWIPLDQTVAIDGILPVQESNQFHDDDELVIGK